MLRIYLDPELSTSRTRQGRSHSKTDQRFWVKDISTSTSTGTAIPARSSRKPPFLQAPDGFFVLAELAIHQRRSAVDGLRRRRNFVAAARPNESRARDEGSESDTAGRLVHIKQINDRDLNGVHELDVDGQWLVINGEYRMPLSSVHWPSTWEKPVHRIQTEKP
jgi:hypothetical protein